MTGIVSGGPNTAPAPCLPASAPPDGFDERSRWSVAHERQRGSDRLEAFSDAVIAIMLTVLSLRLLEVDADSVERVGLPAALLGQWPSFLAFALTFLVVGQIWITHHNMWRYVEKVDQTLLVLNLVLLMSIALIPFCARLLAESLKLPDTLNLKLATVIYAANAFGMAVLFNFSLWWAHGKGLINDRLNRDLYRAIRRRFLIGPSIYLFALLIALVLPWISIVSYVGVVALYVWPGAGDLPTGRDTRVANAAACTFTDGSRRQS
ncbi:TMEM175 family protein [Aureimonas leprariae]|uniref:DUF1211 domain-containing protein n=1 Tax=Plantimonas leprariae TaxID=2615207 RepID=A0A7V7PM36_9HYPH|nr:TMEM175 family protein [Aureimonas leprariae]KAB0677578.1 DUF1211 domain-containing protein [Aureimonas leprariae]